VNRKLLLLLLIAAGPVFAGHDWDRYAVIMERSPFGKEPLIEESAEQAKPAGEFAKQYRLCMLYEDTQGQLKAGIVSKVNNKNFFLQAGENGEEFTLVEVRLEEGIAVLRQGSDTAQLILEGLGTPILSAPKTVATASPSFTSPAALIRRGGAKTAPEHIVAALTDSSPKQAQITVRKTVTQSAAEDPSGGGDTALRDESGGFSQPAAVRKAPSANYLVQSVPKRWNPF
jgi:hypothetical protein